MKQSSEVNFDEAQSGRKQLLRTRTSLQEQSAGYVARRVGRTTGRSTDGVSSPIASQSSSVQVNCRTILKNLRPYEKERG